MIIRIRNAVVVAMLFLFAGLGSAHGQMNAGGRSQGGQPGNGGFGGPGMSGRELGPPPGFTRTPERDWPQPGRRAPREDYPEAAVGLNDAVSMVQERFNATAVKTDTVREGGQMVYRIRLLSADRSKVWTVSVDARTGRIN